MRVLVTGADGLLGANLVRELLEEGLSVRVFIQHGSPSRTLDDLAIDRVTGDLLSRDEHLDEALDGCDAVFHCAAITDMWADPSLTWRVNLEGTRRVLDACLSAGVTRLVCVGSASSFRFGTIQNPGGEGGSFPDEYRGIAYMESKRRLLDLVMEYVERRQLDALVVMPTFMLGPYDARPSSGELLRQFVVRRLPCVSPGGRNFVHVHDVARAMLSALRRGATGSCYILGGENLSYLDFFTKVARIAGMSPPRFILPKGVIRMAGAAGSLYQRLSGQRAPMDLRMARLSLYQTYYSSAKAVQELDMAQTPIEEAIEQSLQGLKAYGHLK